MDRESYDPIAEERSQTEGEKKSAERERGIVANWKVVLYSSFFCVLFQVSVTRTRTLIFSQENYHREDMASKDGNPWQPLVNQELRKRMKNPPSHWCLFS